MRYGIDFFIRKHFIWRHGAYSVDDGLSNLIETGPHLIQRRSDFSRRFGVRQGMAEPALGFCQFVEDLTPEFDILIVGSFLGQRWASECQGEQKGGSNAQHDNSPYGKGPLTMAVSGNIGIN